MTAHKPHSAMKDSGVAWLGKVPAHWDIKPIWAMFQAKKQTDFPNEQLLSVYRDYGVIPKDSRDDNKNRESEDLSPYQLVVEGDLVTNKMKTWQGSIAISNIRGIVSPAYFVYGAKHGQNNRYIHYLLRSAPYIAGYQSISKGIRVGQWDLDADKFRLFPILIPPLAEQNDIVRELESETTRIDQLIARKTHFIELLAEKRQALITHAVTKGLNPKAKMKDSGLEWLGKVPEHWSVAPFRIATWYQEGPGIMAADFVEEGIPLLRVSGVQSQFASLEGCNYLDPEKVAIKWRHFRVDVGDLLISASATTGSISEVSDETAGAIPYTGIIRLKPSKLIEKEYLKSFLASQPFHEQINLFKVGSTIQHYGPTHLSQMKIVLPPIPEQKKISVFIRVRTARIDALIAKTERSIELLREHRTALITAVVTGKIDLRESA